MYRLDRAGAFKKDFRRLSRDGRSDMESLIRVMSTLQGGGQLPPERLDHPLRGKWDDCRERHIGPDWLLIYRIADGVVRFVRTGSHAELYEKKRADK